MECCASQQDVLKKPIAELASRTTTSGLLDSPPRASLEVRDAEFIIHESPPGVALRSSPLLSSSILRI
jgi:hypothetical protein